MLSSFTATLVHARARLGELHLREQGVTAVEYALMIAIVGMLMAGAFYALFNSVNTRYGTVSNCLESGPLPDVCSPPPGP